ncbi:hypothetical protein T11_1304 [Trichinella zimbabwensis]|uniref:Uncharacterized protein n=1 Tax=Trichinella zimbabwensis TaxID=268475 RepID=A0A0V1GUT0_9BILA|nr:hypothetical protein T11_1304 [Trichinella zimbabwensis]
MYLVGRTQKNRGILARLSRYNDLSLALYPDSMQQWTARRCYCENFTSKNKPLCTSPGVEKEIERLFDADMLEHRQLCTTKSLWHSWQTSIWCWVTFTLSYKQLRQYLTRFGSFIPNGENRPLVLSSDACDHGFVSVAYSAITCCLMKARKTCACVRIATTYAEGEHANPLRLRQDVDGVVLIPHEHKKSDTLISENHAFTF